MMTQKIALKVDEPQIPDEWWVASGMLDHVIVSDAYPTNFIREIRFVVISEIEPIRRSPSTRDFDEIRMIKILRGFSNQSAIPPIFVNEKIQGNYKYVVSNGFHRYWATRSVGYVKVPVIVISTVV